MKDIKGKELELGQKVVFTWGNDPNVYEGIITRFTKMKVEINYKYHGNTIQSKSLKYPNSILIICM